MSSARNTDQQLFNHVLSLASGLSRHRRDGPTRSQGQKDLMRKDCWTAAWCAAQLRSSRAFAKEKKIENVRDH
eukprot:1088837-Amphidinium_carterae.2